MNKKRKYKAYLRFLKSWNQSDKYMTKNERELYRRHNPADKFENIFLSEQPFRLRHIAKHDFLEKTWLFF